MNLAEKKKKATEDFIEKESSKFSKIAIVQILRDIEEYNGHQFEMEIVLDKYIENVTSTKLKVPSSIFNLASEKIMELLLDEGFNVQEPLFMDNSSLNNIDSYTYIKVSWK